MKFAVPIWTALKIYIYNEYMYFNSMYENPYGKCGRFDIATKGMHGLATFMQMISKSFNLLFKRVGSQIWG